MQIECGPKINSSMNQSIHPNDEFDNVTPSATTRKVLPPATNENKPPRPCSLPALWVTVRPVTGVSRLTILRRLVGDRLAVIVSGMVRRLASGIVRRLRRLICSRGLVFGGRILLLIRTLCTGVHRVLWTGRAARVSLVQCWNWRRRIRPTRRGIWLAGWLVGWWRLICWSICLSCGWWAAMLRLLVALVWLGVGARCRVVRCRWWSVARCCGCCSWCQWNLSVLAAVSCWHLRQTLKRWSSWILRPTHRLWVNTTQQHNLI